MNKRYLTAAILVAVIFPALIIKGVPLYILMFLLGEAACYEISKLSTDKWPLWGKIMNYILMPLFMFSSYIRPDMILIISGFALIGLFTLLIFYEQVTFEQIGLLYIFFNLMGLMCYGLNILSSLHPLGIFFMVCGTIITDTGAYFAGRTLGKRKLNKRISPNKTIEGAIGGYISGAVASLIFGIFVMSDVFEYNPVFIIVSSLLMPAVGQIGDLAFSAIKRRHQIKDFSNLFPGHGGALDRLDSVSFNLMLNAILFLLLGR